MGLYISGTLGQGCNEFSSQRGRSEPRLRKLNVLAARLFRPCRYFKHAP
jgi:hypothetical protein